MAEFIPDFENMIEAEDWLGAIGIDSSMIAPPSLQTYERNLVQLYPSRSLTYQPLVPVVTDPILPSQAQSSTDAHALMPLPVMEDISSTTTQAEERGPQITMQPICVTPETEASQLRLSLYE